MAESTLHKEIRMVDLITQHGKIQEEIEHALSELMTSARFIKGPVVSAFESSLAKCLSVPHVISCANGTDALQIAMMALGLTPGDEVITADFTYIATAEVIALLGLTPVLVDVDPHTFNIDPAEIRCAITPKTKAIVPVHLYGQCADMEPIMEIAREHNLYVIEDAAQAISATYTFSNGETASAGTMGHVGTTSFFPSKNLGCYGDGGAIFTKDEELAKRISMVANHGQSKKYIHDVIGVNSRLDAMQAAILNIKLRHLPTYITNRQKAAAFYDHAFQDVPALDIPFRTENSSHVFHQYTLKTKGINRNELKEYLATKGIPSMIYYPIPLHLQKAFYDERHLTRVYPHTEALCESVISVPMHTELDEEQLTFISDSVKAFMS